MRSVAGSLGVDACSSVVVLASLARSVARRSRAPAAARRSPSRSSDYDVDITIEPTARSSSTRRSTTTSATCRTTGSSATSPTASTIRRRRTPTACTRSTCCRCGRRRARPPSTRVDGRGRRTSASRSATPTARSPASTPTRSRTGSRGALNGFADHDELVWNAVGTEWPVPIEQATRGRARARPTSPQVGCSTGPFGSNLAVRDARPANGARPRTFVARRRSRPVRGHDGHASRSRRARCPTPKPILEERFNSRRRSGSRRRPAASRSGMLVLLVGHRALPGVVRSGATAATRARAVDAAYGPGEPDGAARSASPLLERARDPGRVRAARRAAARAGRHAGRLQGRTRSTSPRPSSTSRCAATSRSRRSTKARFQRKGDWKLTQLKDDDAELMPYERDAARRAVPRRRRGRSSPTCATSSPPA